MSSKLVELKTYDKSKEFKTKPKCLYYNSEIIDFVIKIQYTFPHYNFQ